MTGQERRHDETHRCGFGCPWRGRREELAAHHRSHRPKRRSTLSAAGWTVP